MIEHEIGAIPVVNTSSWKSSMLRVLGVGAAVVACSTGPRERQPVVASTTTPLEHKGALATSPEQRRTCVHYWPEARFRNYAYDHVVHLLSRCDARALCAVSSDVNPRAVLVELPPGERAEVVTFRGSPAREFRPFVECRA